MCNPDFLADLDQDHPGFRDKAYREQRDTIADLAIRWIDSRDAGSVTPMPRIEYRPEQHGVWNYVFQKIHEGYLKNAVEDVFEGLVGLQLNPSKIPSLEEVNLSLFARTGFKVVPVPGLVRSKYFFSSLMAKEFYCTQYIRHESMPDFTPEPDICHDVLGHVPLLMAPKIAQSYLEFGQAAVVAEEHEILELENLYWFTIEYGLCLEKGKIKTYGAGNLSSVADLYRCIDPNQVEHKPFDIETMAHTKYDPTIQQPCLFLAPSLDFALNSISEYLRKRFIAK